MFSLLKMTVEIFWILVVPLVLTIYYPEHNNTINIYIYLYTGNHCHNDFHYTLC